MTALIPPFDRVSLAATGNVARGGSLVRTFLGLVAAVVSFTIVRSTAAQVVVFEEVAQDVGLDFVNEYEEVACHNQRFEHGGAVGDYDNDGWLDVYLANGNGFANQLFHNKGDGTFEDLAASSGDDLTLVDEESKSALWVDYDGDDYLDLLVLNDGNFKGSEDDCGNCIMPLYIQNYLYHNNGDGTFTDVTVSSNVPDHTYWACYASSSNLVGGAAAADLTGDGYPEIYIAYWQDFNALWLNEDDGAGNRVFRDVGAESGAQPILQDGLTPKDSWTPLLWDIDGDGDLDIHQNVDFMANELFINQGLNGTGVPTFVDVAPDVGLNTSFNEMGQTLGDIENDGDFDIYITNQENPFDAVESPSYPDDDVEEWNRLFINNSTLDTMSFTDLAVLADDKTIHRTGWGWGCTFFDYNHDSFVDLAVVNGQYSTNTPVYDDDITHMFKNNGDGSFIEVRDEVQFMDSLSAKGVMAFDFDRDGDLDLLLTNNAHPLLAQGETGRTKLYRNNGGNTAGNWVMVNPIGAPPNQRALGAVVHLKAEGLSSQMRLITAGTSFLSQEPDEAHFGLAASGHIESITVEWGYGHADTVVTDIPDTFVNNWINIRQNLIGLELGDLLTVGDSAPSQFTATLAYSDGRMEEVTDQTTWTLEPTEYAAISASGLLTPVDLPAGTEQTVTLQGTFEHMSVEATVTIKDGTIEPPTIGITSPAADLTTDQPTVTITGTASGSTELTSVTWSNTAGGSGPCSGLTNWTTGPITLAEGLNVISVSATDTLQNSSVATRSVTYQPEEPLDNGNDNFDNGNGNDNGNDNDAGNVNVNTNTPNNNNSPPNMNNSNINDNMEPNNNSDQMNDNGGPTPPPPPVCGLFGFIPMVFCGLIVGWARIHDRRKL